MRLPPDNSGMPDIPHIRRHTQPHYYSAGDNSHEAFLDAAHILFDREKATEGVPGDTIMLLTLLGRGHSISEVAWMLQMPLRIVKDRLRFIQANTRLSTPQDADEKGI